MIMCHGAGDNGRGCCFVAGQVCPLRLRMEDGRVYDNTDANLGTIDSYINSKTSNSQARRRAKDQLTGPKFVCRAAMEVVMADAATLTDRAKFETNWNNHAEYLEKVRPEWVAVEVREGLPVGSYQCSIWKGTGRFQCCFAEDETTNATKIEALSPSARTVREKGGR